MPDLRRLLALSAAALLTGCGIVDSDPWDDRRLELNVARAHWAAADPGSYRFTFFRGCFCAGPIGRYVVTVTDGTVTAAVGEPDGDPVADAALGQFATMEDLFDVIEDAIRNEADGFQVAYDPEYAFPTLIDLDRDENAVDDELKIEAGDLVPLP